MVKNAAMKKAARAYQAAHPGMPYPQALRESQREYSEKLRARNAERAADSDKPPT